MNAIKKKAFPRKQQTIADASIHALLIKLLKSIAKVCETTSRDNKTVFLLPLESHVNEIFVDFFMAYHENDKDKKKELLEKIRIKLSMCIARIDCFMQVTNSLRNRNVVDLIGIIGNINNDLDRFIATIERK